MTIRVTIHLTDGNTYNYEYREIEQARTPKEVADEMAQQLAESRGDEAATLQRSNDEAGHSFTVIPMSAIVRIDVADQEAHAYIA
jgi:hypothetical protein